MHWASLKMTVSSTPRLRCQQLPVAEVSGVRSLIDVAVFAMDPCQGMFAGVFDNVGVFYTMANCLDPGRPDGRPRILTREEGAREDRDEVLDYAVERG
ncbi:hypothetical protein GGR52DRAFT_180871 [Hypoxylon sp. FL1284]|nr:hypothetical protein GGR52DRAFT_180871 [Hypoxylon sp. FL1284]